MATVTIRVCDTCEAPMVEGENVFSLGITTDKEDAVSNQGEFDKMACLRKYTVGLDKVTAIIRREAKAEAKATQATVTKEAKKTAPKS